MKRRRKHKNNTTGKTKAGTNKTNTKAKKQETHKNKTRQTGINTKQETHQHLTEK